MRKKSWIAIRLLFFFTIVTGVVYPLLIWGVGQSFFKFEANGDKTLIAQGFTKDIYFWPRPSAIDYNPIPSGGSNLGPTSAELKKQFDERKSKMPGAPQEEMLFTSASGLDPDISPQSAFYQLDRVANARGLSVADKQKLFALIQSMTAKPQFGILGDERVNVLKLNFAMDAQWPK